MQKISQDGEYVWVFKRPDNPDTVQIPEPETPKEDEFWWAVMVVLLQIFKAI
mgnify:CR=1 FL=1